MASVYFIAATAAAGIASAASASVVRINQTFYNTTAQAKTYDVLQSITLLDATPNAVISGTVASVLTDLNGDGASVASIGTTAIYTALLQDSAVQTLLPGGWQFSVGQYLSDASTPASFGNVAVQSANSGSMAIHLQFTLSAGDKVTFASNFVLTPTPAPGALGLAAVAGIGARGRRRRA
jgi:MYXO-CTERM domain-containing protein